MSKKQTIVLVTLDTKADTIMSLEEAIHLLYQRCYAADLQGIKDVVEKYDVDPCSESGEALVYTIRGNGTEQEKEEILQYFKSLAVDLSVRDKVALQWAIRTHNLDLIKFLESEGVDLQHNIEPHLFSAAMDNDTMMLDYLVSAGATVSGGFLSDLEEFELPQEALNIIGRCPIIDD